MRKILFSCILILLVMGVALFLPARPANLASHPDPVAGYAQALAQIESILASEGSSFNPVCRLQFMDHGSKTDKVIVMVHGYTNCPEQFRQLGEAFYDQGYNVLIAPLPHHGLANRMTAE